LEDSETEQAMLVRVGVSWWPENATMFVEKFISISSGGD
jgi:hypothetical protein